MSTSDMSAIEQGANLSTAIGLVRAKAYGDVKLTHYPKRGLGLESWSMSWIALTRPSERWIATTLFVLLVVAMIHSLSFKVYWFFALPCFFLLCSVVYLMNRPSRRLVFYDDGYALLDHGLFFKPPIKEMHSWREVLALEIRPLSAELRTKIVKLEQAHRYHMRLTGFTEHASDTAKYEQSATSILDELEQLYRDYYSSCPPLDPEELFAATPSEHAAGLYGCVRLAHARQPIGVLSLSQSQAIQTMFGVMGQAVPRQLVEAQPGDEW